MDAERGRERARPGHERPASTAGPDRGYTDHTKPVMNPPQAGEEPETESTSRGGPDDRSGRQDPRQVIERLLESERRLQAIIDATGAVVYVKDTAGKYLLVNRRFEELFHLTREGIRGRKDHDLFPQHVADAFRANDVRVLQDGRVVEFEESVPQDDGIHTYISNKFPLFDGGNQPYAVCGISTDITERKQAEQGLQESEQRLRSIAENAPGFILQVDHEGSIRFINRTHPQYSAGDVIGSSVFDWSPEPEHPKIAAALDAVFTQGRAQEYEITASGPYGSEAHYDCNAGPVVIDDEVVAAVIVATDVTARRKADEALQQSEVRFRKLVQNATDIITLFDRDCTILYESPSVHRILGYRPEQLVGNNGLDYVNEDDRDAVRQAFERLLAVPGVGVPTRFRWRHRDGSWVHLEAIGANQLDDPAIRGIVVNSRDISDQVRAEEQAAEHRAQVAHTARVSVIGEMASGMAHQLNQPLAAIANFANGCRRRVDPDRDPELAQVLTRIESEAQRAGVIIRTMREFVRTRESKRRPVDVKSAVRAVVRFLKFETQKINGQIEMDLTDEDTTIDADAVLIEQVLVNVVRNALDAMRDKPSEPRCVSIRVTRDADEVGITIADQGPGVPGALRQQVFDSFFTTKSQGMGLGLKISRTLIEDHNGRIRVDDDPGGGARFHITIPAMPNRGSNGGRGTSR
ncbi:MAG: hypothetical protein CMJ18_27160 [Phycisphaeraceae bacterium]|nr:hypothetical protein [Phycisphaeraceae bacterium]